MLIINNMDFKGDLGLTKRTGSDKDVANLQTTFSTFGFLCETENNLKGQVSI